MRTERRECKRFAFKLPVLVQVGEMEIKAHTNDLSAQGVALELDCDQQPKEMTFEMTFPPEITYSTHLRVRCEGSLVRIIATEAEKRKFAVRIRRYQFVSRPKEPEDNVN